MHGNWEGLEQEGATRRACMGCGAHTLVVDESFVTCTCCGSGDLRTVGTAEAHHLAITVARDRRRR